MPASAEAHASNDHHEGDDEGSSSNVEYPARQGGSGDGNTLEAAQLGEVLEIRQVRLMKAQLANVFQSFTHLLLFLGWHEGEGVPGTFIVEDAVVEVHRPVGGDKMMRESTLTPGRNLQLLHPLLQMYF